MIPWDGFRESADITYDDAQGIITPLLIEKGYLDQGIWENRKPRYFIEVKSTFRDCNTAFYMSHSQYEKVRASR